MLECAMRRFVSASLLPVIALAVPMMLPAGPAASHPHVFVTSKVTVLFDDGRVTGLRLDWLFDDFFSAQLLADFDADGDGRFDETEMAALHDGAFVSLRDYGWFTHLYLDGAAQDSPEPLDFQAIAEGEYVRYRFELPLGSPIDPAATRFEVAIYDQEYYVELLLDGAAPVAFENAPPACRVTVVEDEAHAYYFDMVYPQMIRLDCGVS
jgi:ABC-type uncharacterized transport system substrate-binding protein